MRVMILIFFLFFHAVLLKGQTVDLRFQQFENNNFFSSLALSDVEQDQLGFIWLASNNGIHRYDGREIKSYLSVEGKQFGVNESAVTDLYSDNKGVLWMSLNAHLCYYDVYLDSVVTVVDEFSLKGLSTAYVSGLKEDSLNNLYIYQSNSVFRYDRDNDWFSEVFKTVDESITSFCFDENNLMWVATKNQVFTYNSLSNQYEKTSVGQLLPNEATIVDLQFHNGNLWIACSDHGAFSFNTTNGTMKSYGQESEYENYIRSFYTDKDGFLWLVSMTGLKLYVADRDFFQGYYPNDDDNYSIKPYISKIFQDRDKNYWTLHVPGGIGFSPQSNKISRFDSKINSPFRLTANSITAVSEDQFGNLWMGNAFNGIDVFYWQKGRTITYGHDQNKKNSLGKGAILELFFDSNQNMWVGSYWGGLQRFRPETEDFVSYIHRPDHKNSISGNDIRSIAEDRFGNLWVCVHGKGIDRYDPKNDQWTNFNQANNQLSNDFTFEIAFDSNGKAWVASAWGLSSLIEGDSVFRNYFNLKTDSSSISANMISTVHIDRLNRVWAGTPNGLNLFLPDSDSFKRYGKGFKNKNVVSVSSDDSLKIWCGTFNGISRVDPETGNVLNLGRDHGFISDVFEARSVYNNKQGTLFFGTKDGINYFNTNDIKYNIIPPKVFVTSLKIIGRDAVLGEEIDCNIVVAKELHLDYDHKMVLFTFTAIDYVESDKQSYSYKLEGFDDNWNLTENQQNSAIYTNLKPGRYTFKVKAANKEGRWSDDYTQLIITVKPPFWKHWLFRFAVLLALVSITYLYIFNRERNLRKVNSMLEQKVLARTEAINEQNILLEKQKLDLIKIGQLKDRFFNILAHDLRSPVYSIVQLTGLLKERLSNDKMVEYYSISEIIHSSVENTQKLLDDLLMWGKAQSGREKTEMVKIKVVDLLQQSINVYQQIAEEKNIVIKVDLQTDAEVYVDVDAIRVVFRNLISNAIKFSYPKGKIVVSDKTKHGFIKISITDNGVGIKIEKLISLFDYSSKQSTKGTSGEEGSGLGLLLAKELAEQNNGKLSVKSKPGVETKFTVTLPLV